MDLLGRLSASLRDSTASNASPLVGGVPMYLPRLVWDAETTLAVILWASMTAIIVYSHRAAAVSQEQEKNQATTFAATSKWRLEFSPSGPAGTFYGWFLTIGLWLSYLQYSKAIIFVAYQVQFQQLDDHLYINHLGVKTLMQQQPDKVMLSTHALAAFFWSGGTIALKKLAVGMRKTPVTKKLHKYLGRGLVCCGIYQALSGMYLTQDVKLLYIYCVLMFTAFGLIIQMVIIHMTGTWLTMEDHRFWSETAFTHTAVSAIFTEVAQSSIQLVWGVYRGQVIGVSMGFVCYFTLFLYAWQESNSYKASMAGRQLNKNFRPNKNDS